MSGEEIRNLYKFATIATEGTKLFPATLVTQLLLESGAALSQLARRAHNYFGIKAGTTWTGPVISMTTAEFIDGRRVTFRGTDKVYPNRAAAIRDGANMQTLFRFYSSMTEGFKGWVDFLQKKYAVHARRRVYGHEPGRTIRGPRAGRIRDGPPIPGKAHGGIQQSERLFFLAPPAQLREEHSSPPPSPSSS